MMIMVKFPNHKGVADCIIYYIYTYSTSQSTIWENFTSRKNIFTAKASGNEMWREK